MRPLSYGNGGTVHRMAKTHRGVYKLLEDTTEGDNRSSEVAMGQEEKHPRGFREKADR